MGQNRGMARVTLQTIADKVGVSRMTVSNAFSRPDQLSRQLRRRILLAAEELGYAGPDPAARALARGTTGAVGILLTDSLRDAFTDEVATAFLGAIAEELAPTGLALTLLSASSKEPGILPARDVPMDGALVYSCNLRSTAVDWLRRRKLPLVFVDQTTEPGVPGVNIDDRGGARRAAQHLVDLGHRRVGIVTISQGEEPGIVGDPHLAVLPDDVGHVARERLLGWLEALETAAITPIVVRQPTSDEHAAVGSAELLLAGHHPPTAVLCFSDVIAFGVVRAATNRGITVPDDLSVVGFDDNPLAQRMQPALTTVRQDVAAKGREAAAALNRAIARSRSGATDKVRHIVLPTELVVRDSTASPPPSVTRRSGRSRSAVR
jgi:DNA-binding LacI/PurR family transcriptional regulator